MIHALPLLFVLVTSVAAAAPLPEPVVWRTPSRDSIDSMPLSGRLGAGANVWVQDGSIWIYLAHNGAYDEQGCLLKLGCLRITPTNTAMLAGTDFSQELDPATGVMSIRGGGFSAELWFAADNLIIETKAGTPQALDVAFGTWRDQPRNGLKLDVWGAMNMKADHVTADASGFLWFHENAEHGYDVAGGARRQGIGPEAVVDPTTRRVSGGAVAVADGLSDLSEGPVHWQDWNGKAWQGRTRAKETQVIAVALRAAEGAVSSVWQTQAAALLKPEHRASARSEELKRWSEFWDRSHIVVNGDAEEEDPGRRVGVNYQLFRYMLACNRGGELPLLFNGGIFTTDNPPGRIRGNNNNEVRISAGAPCTPDFRRWMGCHFMSQNQRWLGWPTLAAGDADLLAPSLAFYRNRLPTAAARAKGIGAEGCVYPEPLDIWGLCCVAPRADGLCGASHLTYHFSMMLEHAWMALQGRDALGISLDVDLPWISGTVLFYDSFYRAECKKRTGQELGADGKLVIYPACGLEYAGGATDPIEVVSGLRRITDGLLKLPTLPDDLRSRLATIRGRLPELPVGTRDGKRALLPARKVEREYNKWEPIEMYAAWPYRWVGVTQPDTLPLARDTWTTVPADRARLCKQDFSWMANVANMAALGWPAEAKQRVLYKLANTNAPQARFTAFFGPGHDWLPDHNWGGSGMTGLQEMLLSPEPGANGRLHLFAGWPREWDVDFKLHAPGPTVVECVYRKGKVERLNVTPSARAKDIVNWLETPPAK